MFGPVDKLIEKILRRAMRSKKEKIVNKKFAEYCKKFGLNEDEAVKLREKLETECLRIIAIVDESILRERIKRARYTFWITAIIGTAVIVALAAYPVTTSIAPFFAPLVAAVIAWAVSLATIPISYLKRVTGAMDSAAIMFELERAKASTAAENTPSPMNTAEIQQAIQRLEKELNGLRDQLQQQGLMLPDTLESQNIQEYAVIPGISEPGNIDLQQKPPYISRLKSF